MNLCYSRRSIKHLEGVIKFGRYLAIVPNYNFDKQTIVWKRIYKSCISTVFLISFGIFLYCVINSWEVRRNGSKLFTIFEFILGVTMHCSLEVFLLTASLGSAFWNADRWKNLFKSFAYLETFFRTERVTERNLAKNFYLQLLLTSVIVIANLVAMIVTVWEYARHFENYYILITQLHASLLIYARHVRETIMCSLILAIKCKYEDLNDFLRKNVNSSKSIRNVSNLYGVMNDIVDGFNKIFGCEILLTLSLTFVLQLTSFNFFRKLVSQAQGAEDVDSLGNTGPMITIGIVSMIGPILVMFSCDWAIKEAEKLVPTCYKCQAYFPTFSEEKQELLNLANQIINNKPAFTAAGFFEVNCRTLFTLFGTTTTYFIVIVQFNPV
ncbi:hypothetical protein NQ315_011460 [Exocentrus adspersus]|uniref:Gustatory receptor n=1 Tax=Exocentrus adspersus TaxID=1586481 RepID=A0AAV8VVS3_9CUCU|nr:hypothetical protein NQ315_011460 [Exocentrus adspersus]